jgi:hypothetical protein
MLDSPPKRPLLGPTSFGHDGAGGQNAYGDVRTRVGFGYINNQMDGFTDQRTNLLTVASPSVWAWRRQHGTHAWRCSRSARLRRNGLAASAALLVVALVRVAAAPGKMESTQVVSTSADSRPRSAIPRSRSLNFWILPVTVSGNSSTGMT